jgi:uncharacterized protein YndB with AHSA1/START domain
MKVDGALEHAADGGYVIAFERLIAHRPEELWKVLTEPARLARWLGEVEVDLRVGGAYVIRFRDSSVVMTGEITVLEPGRLIEYSWLENLDRPRSLVRWEILPCAGGCTLRLTHRFPPGCGLKDMTAFLGGWHAFLDAIPRALAGGFVPYADERPLEAAYRQRYAQAT